jgi:hypothetical protein
MRASELRIGNLILYNKCGSFKCKSTVIKVGFETIFNVANKFKNFHYNSIPLTEEWLLKFGFTRHHTDYSNNIIFIKNVPNNTEFEWGVYPNEVGSGIQIQNRELLRYVHQLQNIYFALTGEELEYK